MNGMTLIVKTITRLVLVFIVVFSAAVVLHGHLTPGGGFAGGSMLACGFMLLLLAHGATETKQLLTECGASAWDSVGALAFLLVAVLGYSARGFFANFIGHGRTFALASSGTVLVNNIAIGIKVGACLFAVYLMLAAFRLPDEEQEEAK